jgi:hypothetical protein
MSQPEAALYIQPPTLETSVAVQITANAARRNGAANDTGLTEVEPIVALIANSDTRYIRPSSGGEAKPPRHQKARYLPMCIKNRFRHKRRGIILSYRSAKFQRWGPT